ncbi:heme oxygenase (biliverdin-producing) [Nodosilinea nodulosa]|uniref:biliverdin-producing heme oxygenase n=1 Tax=Nodosilinea nodulosa TaxID=416001 RepID=UPI00031416AE|nr:heme oxygenase (biliverdin-producing) [Nodosilinea nodulosa]
MTDLAQRLREGTQASHTLSENTAFMKCFLKGIVELEPFRKLTADLYFLYNTLEAEMARHRDHPVVGPMIFAELLRTPKLEDDLAYYYGDRWQHDIAATPAGLRYVNRILEVSASHPALLVAHAYVRYMGDLSGGQGLRHIVRSALSLPPDRGTGLHEFDQLPTVEAKRDFKLKYREALNALPADEILVQQLVDEANLAFALNRNVFHELEPDVRAAVGDHVFDLITRQDRPGSTERHPHHDMVALMATE